MKLLIYLFNILSVFNFNSNFTQEEVIKNEEKIDSIIAINETSYVKLLDGNSYLCYENEEYVIDNLIVNKSLDTINNIYLFCNNNYGITIYMFNKFSKEISLYTFNDVYVENVYDINNCIYLVGSINNHGIIYILSYELTIISERVFYGEGLIRINHILLYNNSYYITVYKDGITNNSEFVNHGNDSEIKSIIVKLDLEFNILNTCYLNEKCQKEIIKNIYIKDGYLKLLLETNEDYYIYNVSLTLDYIRYYSINSKDDLELIIHFKKVNGDLLLNKTKKRLILSDEDSLIDIYQMNDVNCIGDYKIINGRLLIYVSNPNLVIYKITEYEVIKQEDKILNYFNLDYLDTSNIHVESWFGNLEIIVDYVTPYFDKTLSGKYEIHYIVLLENNPIAKLNTFLIVEDYTNFCNNGIYNVNKALEFFGTATVNDTPVYYGACLNEVGEYDIEITNINGDKELYHIYIVEDYYKDERIINTETINIYDDMATIELNLNNLIVDEIIINNQSYQNYKIFDNKFIIEFNKNSNNIESYFINRIVFLDKDEKIYYDINKQFTFNYLKKAPCITMNKILESEHFKLSTQVIDQDKAFAYLKAVCNSKEEIIYNKKQITTNNLKLYFSYELGNGEIKDILICEIAQNNIFNINLNLNYDSGSLASFDLDINIDKSNLNLLKVSDTSLLDFYEKIENSNYLRNIIMISIALVTLVGFVFMIYLVIKKRKQKVF